MRNTENSNYFGTGLETDFLYENKPLEKHKEIVDNILVTRISPTALEDQRLNITTWACGQPYSIRSGD